MRTNTRNSAFPRALETVLLSAHNICFGLEIRKMTLNFTLLSRGLPYEAKLKPGAHKALKLSPDTESQDPIAH